MAIFRSLILTGVAVFASCINSRAPAQTSSASDGNQLLEACTAALKSGDHTMMDYQRGQYCIGFVGGVYSGLNYLEAYNTAHHLRSPVCLPDDTLRGSQLVRIVNKYLADHPQELNKDQAILAINAFVEAYPCKE
jgi:hypothetical protein